MDNPIETKYETGIRLDRIRLYFDDRGQLVAHHDAFAAAVEIDPKALERWLSRQLRELV